MILDEKELRKTSLDELPQFINVIKGDVSIIELRRLVEDEIDAHKGIFLRRSEVCGKRKDFDYYTCI